LPKRFEECGTPETVSDGDKALDCNDECADDPLTDTPGVCGCNKEDKDTDSDGVVDCIDGCPEDSKKVELGQCGCSNQETFSDNDGTHDCNDSCSIKARFQENNTRHPNDEGNGDNKLEFFNSKMTRIHYVALALSEWQGAKLNTSAAKNKQLQVWSEKPEWIINK